MAEQRGEHRHHDERADGARPDREPRVTHRHNGGDEEGLVAWRGGGAVSSCGTRAREGLRGVDRTDLGGKDDEEGLDERVREARLHRGVGVWRFHGKRFWRPRHEDDAQMRCLFSAGLVRRIFPASGSHDVKRTRTYLN